MIPGNQRNRKMQINLTCPACGMDLTEPQTQGFVLGAETYCCRGCAEGTGCICNEARIVRAKAGNRPGNLGQRNPENSKRDKNENEEVNTSGRLTGVNKQETRSAPPRQQIRGKRDAEGKKISRGLAKERPSSREEARGRSEFRGKLNNSRIVDRVGTTGVKSR
jgi:hypothetical protein